MSRVFQKKYLVLFGVCAACLLATVLLIGAMERTESADLQESEPVAQSSKGQGYFRILVTAKDRTSGLCDVMMLVSLNREQGSVSVLQIPRDTYAHYGTGGYRKINGAPSSEGMEGLRDFFERAFGIEIDRYVRLSADAFRRAVDAVGGVSISLEEPMFYEDPAQGLSIRLSAGVNTLNGEEAEWFVRYRSGYVRGDLGRMDAQKIFLSAFAKKVMENRSPVGLVRLASAFLDEIETDLTVSDLILLAGEILSVRAEDLSFVTAPGEDVRGREGGSYYVLSALGMDRLLKESFGKKREDFDPDEVFLNRENGDFRRVYESDLSYRIYSSAQIENEGLSIPRT